MAAKVSTPCHQRQDEAEQHLLGGGHRHAAAPLLHHVPVPVEDRREEDDQGGFTHCISGFSHDVERATGFKFTWSRVK